MVNGPAAPGSPERTVNLAPFLRNGGPSAHLTCTGVTMTCPVAAAASGGGVVAGGVVVASCAATGSARTRPNARASRIDFTTASLLGIARLDPPTLHGLRYTGCDAAAIAGSRRRKSSRAPGTTPPFRRRCGVSMPDPGDPDRTRLARGATPGSGTGPRPAVNPSFDTSGRCALPTGREASSFR